jgi:P27 family predicted phage terminase small subunit
VTTPLRPKQPAALRLLRGNPGRRRIKQEPLPERGALPAPPPYLDERARAEWTRTAPELHQLGLLTVCDLAVFAAYCQSYARWVEAEQQLAASSLTIETTNGNVIQSPLVGIARRAAHDMVKFAIEMGLTPGGRQRLATTETRPRDELDDLLN